MIMVLTIRQVKQIIGQWGRTFILMLTNSHHGKIITGAQLLRRNYFQLNLAEQLQVIYIFFCKKQRNYKQIHCISTLHFEKLLYNFTVQHVARSDFPNIKNQKCLFKNVYRILAFYLSLAVALLKIYYRTKSIPIEMNYEKSLKQTHKIYIEFSQKILL